MKTRLALCAAFALLLTGCGSSTTAGDPGSATATVSPSRTTAPAPDAPVLRVLTLGGFVPPEALARKAVEFVITADGTVYLPGAVAAVFPGPMLAPMMTGQLTKEQLAGIIDRAQQDGLLEGSSDHRDGEPNVSDMGTTEVVFDVDGTTITHTAYALGFGKETGSRKKLNQFIQAVARQVAPVATERVQPQEVVVTAFRVRKGETLEVKPTKQPWPDTTSTLSDGTCQIVDDPATIAALEDADELSYFTSGGKTYALAARVSVPGDRGCPGN